MFVFNVNEMMTTKQKIYIYISIKEKKINTNKSRNINK